MLKVYHTATEITVNVDNFIKGGYTMALIADDYIQFELYKPFQKLYVEITTASVDSLTFTAEKWNGTAWVSLDSFYDYTEGFSKSGWITWDLDEEASKVRLTPSGVTTEDIVVKGIGLVFADDYDMQEGYMGVVDLKRGDTTSFIGYHQGARNEILQVLRNSGKYTTSYSLSEWDLLKPEQLREAGKWKALELLFMELSNQVDDKYDQLSRKSNEKFSGAMNLYILSIDLNDDGKMSEAEEFQIDNVMVERI